jgi:hypothetical protein
MAATQVWELWYPEAGATGLLVARCRIAPTTVLWVHAAPPVLAVSVREGANAVARTAPDAPLTRHGKRLPMTRLEIRNGQVLREERWPGPGDVGSVVEMRGAEGGVL